MPAINPIVTDLSHWDPAKDYAQVKAAGYVGVIFKATQGQSYTDDTYVAQQKAAKAAGLKWGSYHFADASGVDGQVTNYMQFACPDPDELFCLDWEDNPGGGGKMSAANAKEWITQVETKLNRPGQCVIYSGNTAKELIKGVDPFFGARRLWLAQYSSTPTCQASWKTYWLWQFTDGQSGPQPHTVPSIGPCDINSYDGTPAQLLTEWATGTAEPTPVPPDQVVVQIVIAAPTGVIVDVKQV